MLRSALFLLLASLPWLHAGDAVTVNPDGTTNFGADVSVSGGVSALNVLAAGSPVEIKQAVDLDQTALGRWHLLLDGTTPANYRVRLPAASGRIGSLVGIMVGGPTQAAMAYTIAASGTDRIDGQSERTVGANTAMVLLSNGSGWLTIGGTPVSQAPNASAVFATAGSATWTVPAGVTMVHAFLKGGGGGGGGSIYNAATLTGFKGGNGAAGGEVSGSQVVVPGTAMAVKIGGGGGGGKTTTSAAKAAGGGGGGGTTTFGVLVAGGGGGGGGSAAMTANYNGGNGGAGGAAGGSGGNTGGAGGAAGVGGTVSQAGVGGVQGKYTLADRSGLDATAGGMTRGTADIAAFTPPSDLYPAGNTGAGGAGGAATALADGGIGMPGYVILLWRKP